MAEETTAESEARTAIEAAVRAEHRTAHSLLFPLCLANALGAGNNAGHRGAPLLRSNKICVFTHLALSAILANVIPASPAQDRVRIDFPEIIKTPAEIQKALERCDGDTGFETAFANWIEMAQPRSPAEGVIIRKTSLRLLEDATDRQTVLGLIDGLLRHALEDVKRDQAIIPQNLADSMYRDIVNAVRKRTYKGEEIAAPAYGLADDGSITEERQARFVERFLNLADPHVARHVQPAKARPAAPPSPVVPKQAAISTDQSVPLGVAGELRHVLLIVVVICLVLGLIRARRVV